MIPTPPHIIAQSATQADDWGALVFIVAPSDGEELHSEPMFGSATLSHRVHCLQLSRSSPHHASPIHNLTYSAR